MIEFIFKFFKYVTSKWVTYKILIYLVTSYILTHLKMIKKKRPGC